MSSGVRQRRGAARQAESDSKVVAYLLKNVAWGILSAPQARDVADFVKQDMDAVMNGQRKAYTQVCEIQRCGTAGAHPQNISKQLTNVFIETLSAPWEAMLYIKNLSGISVPQVQRLFLPHVWLSDLYNNCNPAFQKLLCPSTAKLRQFWQTQVGNPQLDGHPMTARTNWRSRAIPISLHGDGVPTIGLAKKLVNNYGYF